MSKSLKDLKVAFITDSMVSPGGADRLLISLSGIFKDPTIFTTIYNRENYTGRYQIDVEVRESFLGRSRILRSFHRHLTFLTPVAFESFGLSGYDLVISLSAGAAKGVIAQIDKPHIGIILTPPRSLWDMESNTRGLRLRSIYKFFTPYVANYMRIWDQTAIKRVDEIVSISKYIKQKVKRTYGKNSLVIYPGIEEYWFKEPIEEISLPDIPEEFFLVVSRLYDYKRVDWAIDSVKESGKKLVIVGTGPDMDYLRSRARDETTFLGWLEDDHIKALYKRAEALLFCGEEDFGYVPVEAMASGCPVLAYNRGGVTETVKQNETGDFFNDKDGLTDLLENFNGSKYMKKKIISRAEEFNSTRMKDKLKKLINEQVQI